MGQCWKNFSKSVDQRPSKSTLDKESYGNLASINEVPPTDDSEPFSKQQLEALQTLLSQQSQINNTIRMRILVQKGNYISALLVKVVRTNMWIVNSCAFDHMIGGITLLHTYNSCCEHIIVKSCR